MQKKIPNDQRKKALAEKVWLLYFNQTLYDKGIITEAERNRMTHLIDRRSSVK